MLSDEERNRISGMVVVKEPEDKEPYAMENSRILLDVGYGVDEDSGEVVHRVSGDIVSEVFIGNTELEFAKSWRFEVYDVKITGFSVNTKENLVYHHFTADRFEIQGDDSSGEEG